MAELTADEKRRRQAGLGGSDAPIVFDLGWRSPFALWVEKVWGSNDWTTTPQQQRGHDLEQMVAEKAAKRHGITDLYQGGWVDHPSIKWMFANIDYGAGGDTVIECKVSDYRFKGYEWGDDGDPEGVPSHYEIQGRHQMEVTDTERCIVAVLFVDEWELRTYELRRDPEISKLIIDGEHRFWHDNVLAKTAPPVSDGPSAWEAVRLLSARPDSSVDLPDEAIPLIVDYVTANTERLAMEKVEKKAKAELARLMSDAEIGYIGGDTAVTFKASTGHRGRSLKVPSFYRKKVMPDG